ncbi:MAG: carbohydrate-binding protein [Lachnospiraceae bacterium]|nr:carbohydrate-binding protein [Lachnospiraceae bacterium]
MSKVLVKIENGNGMVLCEKSGEEEVTLVYAAEYREGDRIIVEAEEVPSFYHIQLDDAKGRSFVYLTGSMVYEIPFGEKRVNTSPKVFSGEMHVLRVKKAFAEEKENYRNLAENIWDQHGEVCCYPHASANVETRGESVFAALNAIDGVTAAESHGNWPYESWGINRRDDAVWRLDFGRPVKTDRLVVYTRADFPHDNWWEKLTVTFSDGTRKVLELCKGGEAQVFELPELETEWLELSELIKAEDPSPFPALIQLEVYGRG